MLVRRIPEKSLKNPLSLSLSKNVFMSLNNYNSLHTARRLQAIAQAGLEFCHTGYDRDRYRHIRKISVEILENYTRYESAGK